MTSIRGPGIYGLFSTLDRDHFYDSNEEALAAIDGSDDHGRE